MIGRLVAIVIATGSAVCTSQLPEYVQQYAQRLGGAVDELTAFVRQFDADAKDAGLDRKKALDEYRGTDSRFLGERGKRIVGTIERYERLEKHRDALAKAGPFERFAVFARGFERDLGNAAWSDFKPAIPVTLEGIVLAIGGFLIGLLIMAGVFRFLRAVWRLIFGADEEEDDDPEGAESAKKDNGDTEVA